MFPNGFGSNLLNELEQYRSAADITDEINAEVKARTLEHDAILHEIVSALSDDYDALERVELHENKQNDVSTIYKPSDMLLKQIPYWSEITAFTKKLDLLKDYFVLKEDADDFYKATRREVILSNIKKGDIYMVNFRSGIGGRIKHYQLKFAPQKDEKGNLEAFFVGLHNIDDVILAESRKRFEIEQSVAEKTSELRNAYRTLGRISSGIIETLADVVEGRNAESGAHIKRTKAYASILANAVKSAYPKYGLTDETVALISFISPLHDIGKIAIPDDILLKPGKLTRQEFEIMQTHCQRGAEILANMTDIWNGEYNKIAQDICLYHHEKYDGKGYPYGLKGDEIPISAQIVSVADVYDALTNERCYKGPYPHEIACRMIIDGECGAFSDDIMACFKESMDDFKRYSLNPSDYDYSRDKSIARLVTEKEGSRVSSGKEYISEALPYIEGLSLALPSAFFVYHDDESEELLFFNDKLIKYFGCESREEFIEFTGNSFKGIVHPDDYAETEKSIFRQIRENEANNDHVIYRIIDKNGNEKWADDFGQWVHTDDFGDLFFVFLIDITETHAKRNSLPPIAQRRNDTLLQEYAQLEAIGVLKETRILIVDDSDVTREINRDILESQGAEVFEAASGREACDFIEQGNQVDLILMDIIMPGMNGIEATRNITRYNEEKNLHIPVIALTAEGTDIQIKECISAGAYDCLYKPLNIKELSVLILYYARDITRQMQKELDNAQTVANTDVLTGAGSLAAYTDRIVRLSMAVNEDRSYEFTAVYCDCNGLKKINDTLGHNAGDTYIKNCYDILTSVFDEKDVYRIGGDEFVVLLDGCGCKNIKELTQRLEEKEREASLIEGADYGMTSFAFGFASFDCAADNTVGDVIQRADHEMYKNKSKRKQD